MLGKGSSTCMSGKSPPTLRASTSTSKPGATRIWILCKSWKRLKMLPVRNTRFKQTLNLMYLLPKSLQHNTLLFLLLANQSMLLLLLMLLLQVPLPTLLPWQNQSQLMHLQNHRTSLLLWLLHLHHLTSLVEPCNHLNLLQLQLHLQMLMLMRLQVQLLIRLQLHQQYQLQLLTTNQSS